MRSAHTYILQITGCLSVVGTLYYSSFCLVALVFLLKPVGSNLIKTFSIMPHPSLQITAWLHYWNRHARRAGESVTPSSVSLVQLPVKVTVLIHKKITPFFPTLCKINTISRQIFSGQNNLPLVRMLQRASSALMTTSWIRLPCSSLPSLFSTNTESGRIQAHLWGGMLAHRFSVRTIPPLGILCQGQANQRSPKRDREMWSLLY